LLVIPCHIIHYPGKNMPGLLPDVDPNGLLEYSVVYTDRAVNHMSAAFQAVMTDISAILKLAYNAEAVAIIPGSGTFGMEAVARQFATHGMQIAAGVPLMCDEPNDFRSFRIGLFGLDKMYDIERTIASLETVLGDILTSPGNRENE
jgi:aspartate aminotransferase-like enzyme